MICKCDIALHYAPLYHTQPPFGHSDTAKPNETDISKSTDPFRATVYKNPTKDWSPYDLMTLPWVANGTLEFPPGSDKVDFLTGGVASSCSRQEGSVPLRAAVHRFTLRVARTTVRQISSYWGW